jgi:hypothetical protein
MLFEILSTIGETASAALVVATLSHALATTATRRILLAALLTVWFASVVLLGATLALDYRVGIGAPGLGAATAIPVALICFAFFTAPTVRAALFAIPLPVLVAANAARVLGVLFLLLYASNQLPPPFAPAAGWGDIFVGLAAPPVAWLAWRYGARARGLVWTWNLVGLVDLIDAVGLGATSSPGPLQIFTVSPDSSLMTTLPWILIPCFLVPSFLALHVAIFYRLSGASASALASRDRPALNSPASVRKPIGDSTLAVRSLGFLRALYRTLEHLSA